MIRERFKIDMHTKILFNLLLNYEVKFSKHRCCPNSPSLRDHLYASCEQGFGVVTQILMDYCSLFPLLSDGVGINDDNN